MAASVMLSGGSIVDGVGGEPHRADVLVSAGRIEVIGDLHARAAEQVIDCAGRLIFPGFVDSHCHLDGGVFTVDAQRALLRQGVTSVIVGQDGVSYAPGDGVYATRYFASINGAHPTFMGGSVAELLTTYERTTPVNVGYLIPQGIVRHNVMGLRRDKPTAAELEAMVDLVEQGMRDGALGMSTGLDYVPGNFADTDELVTLCGPVARFGGVYVSHLRSYREAGVAEAAEISARAGLPAHISHMHGPTDDLVGWLDAGTRRGADLSFDAYPYDRGCTNLTLLVLPPRLQEMEPDDCVVALQDSRVRDELQDDWLPVRGAQLGLGGSWLDRVEFSYVAEPVHAWAEGLSVSAASTRAAMAPGHFLAEVLVAANLEVGATVPFSNSGEADAQDLAQHSAYMCGSDGIYLGGAPHPRGWGSFARVLATYCRDSGTKSWGTAGWNLSGHPAQRFALGERGRIEAGAVADLCVVDPVGVQDHAVFGAGRQLATGVSDVLVGGEVVLRDDELTGVLSGAMITRSR